jgi:hypothetical protein
MEPAIAADPPVKALPVSVPSADVVPPVATGGAEPPLRQPTLVMASKPNSDTLKTTSLLIGLPFWSGPSTREAIRVSP